MSKFAPGRSGNPKGRPLGRTNKILNAIKTEFGDEQKFWNHLAMHAKAGDVACLQLLTARVKAPFKARSETVKLDIRGDSTKDYVTGVMSAVADGQLAPDEAAAMLNAISAGENILKLDALEKKINELISQLQEHR